MTSRAEVFSQLWERSNGKCMRCGRKLTDSNWVIDHIFPRRYGGSDKSFNLRLLCSRCNCIVANQRFNVTLFQQYLQRMLIHDSRFEEVRIDTPVDLVNGEKACFDIVFSQTLRGEKLQYVVEAKGLTVATAEEVSISIRQLTYYKNNYPNARFVLAIPTTLAKEYRQQIHSAGIILWDREMLRLGIPNMPLPICAAPDIYDELLDRLKNCPPGFENWQIYQKLVGKILTVLFCPPLDSVSEQNADANYRNRRDFVIPNYTDSGYWKELRHIYQAEFIVVDAKNSGEKIEKDDILQVAHYLKSKGAGLFGLIFSRFGASESAERHLQDIWQNEDKMIIILDDHDVEQMLLSKQAKNDPCRLIINKIQEFLLRM